jgi:DivIVA domain-containing protein
MAASDSPFDGQAIIGISRRNLIKDVLASYSIFIDRALVGTIWVRRSEYYAVDPGHHEISVRVGNRNMPVLPQVQLDVAAGEVRLFRTGFKRMIFSWRSLLTLRPRWEDGPWIKLVPLPAMERSEIPASRVTSALSAGSVPASTSDVGFGQVIRGYNTNEVDRFLKDVSTRRQSGVTVPSSELLEAKFHISFLGYDVGEVDSYIADLAKDR